VDDRTRARLEEFLALVRDNRLGELAVEEPGFKLRLRTELASPPCPPAARPVPLPGPRRAPRYDVISPISGVFYRASAPDVPPSVEIGDLVEAGQTVGLVEAMKVFNEIVSERAGRVVEIPAQSGELVSAGQVLVSLEIGPSASATQGVVGW
jgi:acetyl-CoA carboxylase biotin carboxyl carrier protein